MKIMMKRKIILLSLLFLGVSSAYSTLVVDVNKSYSIPKVLEPSSEAVLFLTLTNYGMNNVYSFEADLYAPSCVSILENKKVDVDIIPAGSSYTIPVRLQIGDCKSDIYTLRVDASYTDGSSSVDTDFYYPLIISKISNLLLENVSVPNIVYSGSYFRVSFDLKNEGPEVKDLYIITNSTCAIPRDKAAMYIPVIYENGAEHVDITMKALKPGPCPIYFNIIYRDWQGNILNTTKVLFTSIAQAIPVLSLSSTESISSPGEYGNLTITLSNSGPLDLNSIVLRLYDPSGKIYFDKQELSVGDLSSGSTRKILIKFYVDPEAEGKLYPILINVTYSDDSGVLYRNAFISKIIVSKNPELKAFVSDYDLSSKKLSITVADVDNVGVKGVYVELLPGDGYKIVGSSIGFIGDIDAQDYERVSFKIIPLSQNLTINAVIHYRDASGKEYSKKVQMSYEIPYKESNGVWIYILALIIVGYIVYRWRLKNNKEEE